MEYIIKVVQKLKNNNVGGIIKARMKEFKENRMGDVFKELCFCILTANFNAEKSIKIQEEIGDGFLTLSETELATRLRQLGHRYPNVRARYIVEARKHELKLEADVFKMREWLVNNVKGIGYKEASHFLRNVGYEDVAILDFHILNILEKYNVIKKPKSLTKRRYLEIEEKMREIAKRLEISLGELDLYLWYIETGKVLK
ncbi:N-glycosylase [Methanosarcinales archaeon]|nr:MAG: N-glycosylase [Methanosarcinales archaeon]